MIIFTVRGRTRLLGVRHSSRFLLHLSLTFMSSMFRDLGKAIFSELEAMFQDGLEGREMGLC